MMPNDRFAFFVIKYNEAGDGLRWVPAVVMKSFIVTDRFMVYRSRAAAEEAADDAARINNIPRSRFKVVPIDFRTYEEGKRK